ncbi:hypothetical protein TrST_g10952 [Triparma strigata]|uniref:Uncharacterized protein n=1 Tax=Triparma strigata TaxID=1606541 RepID=A0A9W7EXW9_9STRA|nr:hypothetical protein TrST_g10952 [Triparma strigata]
MCGRARQSASLCSGSILSTQTVSSTVDRKSDDPYFDENGGGDDNMSPGHSGVIVYRKGETFNRSQAYFGCIARAGTLSNPLPPGPGKHFADRMFNAITDDPLAISYSNMLKRGQTCIIPFDGFYEWTLETKLEGGGKQPYYISSKVPNTPLLFAGFYKDVAVGDVDNTTIRSFSICTTRACPEMYGKIHTRMPVILSEEEAVEWLRAGSLPSEAHKVNLAKRLADKCTTSNLLRWWPVTKEINSTKNSNVKEPWKEVKLDRAPSVAGFFAKVQPQTASPQTASHPPSSPPSPPPSSHLSIPDLGFNSPKKSAIPVQWEKSPLHGKYKPPKEKAKVTSKKKKTTKAAPPSVPDKKGNLLSFFDTKLKTSVSPKPSPSPSPSLLQSTPWRCSACTFDNNPSDRTCSICETPRGQPEQSTTKKTTSNQPLWACPVCTLENDEVDQTCAACGSRNETTKIQSSISSSIKTEKTGYVLRFDGGARGNPGPAGAGYVLYDPDGVEIFAGWKFLGKKTNNFAEYTSLIEGLRKAKQLGVVGTAEGDSKLVISQMTGAWKVKHPDMAVLKKKADEVRGGWNFKWIPREDNSQADKMANIAMDERTDGESSPQQTK